MATKDKKNKPLCVPELRAAPQIEIGLNAAIVSYSNNQPQILVVKRAEQKQLTPPPPSSQSALPPLESLPFGPFNPQNHRTLDIGLRRWVMEQTGLSLGYVEQLYTFGDRGRHSMPGDTSPHIVSIGYLALTKAGSQQTQSGSYWRDWYDFLPWEDWRRGEPKILKAHILPKLKAWLAQEPVSTAIARDLAERLRICFGEDGTGWDEEKVLERYELLYEAGLVEEAYRDGRASCDEDGPHPAMGQALQYDHRRILATAVSRLRGKIKYRPVIFELMEPEFTLYELQKIVEAISGSHLHKQNFRRLVENAGLVEDTGAMSMKTGGRPAKLFRFRRTVLQERPAPGVRVRSQQR